MKTAIQLFVIGIVLSMISCQKEFSIENNSGNPPTVLNDTIYLDKAIQVYDDMQGDIDSLVRHFAYDNLKRVTAVMDTNFYNGVPDIITSVSYFYNNNDSLPDKSYSLYQSIPSPDYDTTTHFFTYDVQGRLTRDSSISRELSGSGYIVAKEIIKTQYAQSVNYYDRVVTGLLVPVTVFIDFNHKDTAWLDVNGNVKKDVSHSYTTNPASQMLEYTGTYTYDNKPNPYSRLNIFATFIRNHSGSVIVRPQFNNYITYFSEDYFFGGPSVFSENFTHSFNNKGLLVQSYGLANNGDVDRSYYTYKSL